VRIFDPIEEHEKWLFTSRLRPIENLLRRVVGFCGYECDHALVMSARRQSIEGRRWFDVNGDSLRLRQLREIGKLPIGPQHQQPLKRTSAGAQGLTHGMQPVNQFRLTIASTGWCRRACLR
jgi:hypothetical protein